MASAVPLLVSAYQGYTSYEQNKAAKEAAANVAKPMNQAEALSSAQSQLTPLYDDTLKSTLKNLQTNQIQRGLYGQASSDATTNQAAADLESKKNAAISGLATSLQQGSYDNYYKQQALTMQQQAQANSQLNAALGVLQNINSNPYQKWSWSNMPWSKQYKIAQADLSSQNWDDF